MHYLRTAIERLHLSVPHLNLATPRRALQFFENVTQTGTELANTLSRYPEVRYEPLDFYYVCLQSLGALNERALNDLLTEQGWRGVLWGALLVCLSPEPHLRTILESASGRAPSQQWAVDLAVAMLDGVQWAENPPLQQAILRLRTQLDGLSRPVVVLTSLPSCEQLLYRQEIVRNAYRTAGADAALQALAMVNAARR